MVFRVGQKVVCIDADGAPRLSLGAIYTIKDIDGPRLFSWRGRIYENVGIYLEEAICEDGHKGFAPFRFRPVVETKTDISIFQKMLTPKKEKSNVV
jgi:hypothetical protein